MEKVLDIKKKCFYIHNSFVLYLQSNRHENCDAITFIANIGTF